MFKHAMNPALETKTATLLNTKCERNQVINLIYYDINKHAEEIVVCSIYWSHS